jgi:hypothetical protein
MNDRSFILIITRIRDAGAARLLPVCFDLPSWHTGFKPATACRRGVTGLPPTPFRTRHAFLEAGRYAWGKNRKYHRFWGTRRRRPARDAGVTAPRSYSDRATKRLERQLFWGERPNGEPKALLDWYQIDIPKLLIYLYLRLETGPNVWYGGRMKRKDYVARLVQETFAFAEFLRFQPIEKDYDRGVPAATYFPQIEALMAEVPFEHHDVFFKLLACPEGVNINGQMVSKFDRILREWTDVVRDISNNIQRVLRFSLQRMVADKRIRAARCIQNYVKEIEGRGLSREATCEVVKQITDIPEPQVSLGLTTENFIERKELLEADYQKWVEKAFMFKVDWEKMLESESAD